MIVAYSYSSSEVSTNHHGSHDHDEGVHPRHQQHDFEKHVEREITGTRSVANLGVSVHSPATRKESSQNPLLNIRFMDIKIFQSQMKTILLLPLFVAHHFWDNRFNPTHQQILSN